MLKFKNNLTKRYCRSIISKFIKQDQKKSDVGNIKHSLKSTVVVSKDEVLEQHKEPKPGKQSIRPTKSLVSQKDLSLAYSPGVAIPVLEIAQNPDSIQDQTVKGNMVAVISNGTAILGLGNLGASASKPVMEGKSVLFKKFSQVDSIDICVDTQDPQEFINSVKYLGPSFGGINLEDIKSPDCFVIEKTLSEMMDIPVFHDDQHGTAMVTGAALLNYSILTKRDISELKVVAIGAGAASLSCLNLFMECGIQKENLRVFDKDGLVYKGREGIDEQLEAVACDTNDKESIEEALDGAHVMLGLSIANCVKPDWLTKMQKDPLIMALANPTPEVSPEEVKNVRPDAIMCTGRSDQPNQVNNVMAFPQIFRGALDVRAKKINMEMKLATAHALAEMARLPVDSKVLRSFGTDFTFGKNYIIPNPFDPRLVVELPLRVARAAMHSGVSRITIDLEKQRNDLEAQINPGLSQLKFVEKRMASSDSKAIIAFGEGCNVETIQAAHNLATNKICQPILMGARSRIYAIAEAKGIDLASSEIDVIDQSAVDKSDLKNQADAIQKRMNRHGLAKEDANYMVNQEQSFMALGMALTNQIDGIVLGGSKPAPVWKTQLDVMFESQNLPIGYKMIMNEKLRFIVADTLFYKHPTSEELKEIAKSAARISRVFGWEPRVAMTSFATFGKPRNMNSKTVEDALNLMKQDEKIDFEFDGELNPSQSLNWDRLKTQDFTTLTDAANILVMPDKHSAGISVGMLQAVGNLDVIGSGVQGQNQPIQILNATMNSEDIQRISHICSSQAFIKKERKKMSDLHDRFL